MPAVIEQGTIRPMVYDAGHGFAFYPERRTCRGFGLILRRKAWECRRSSLDRITQFLLLACALVASGGLVAAANSPAGPSWLAWISLIPIFITIRYASPKIALLYGALWGFCLYLFSSASDGAAVTASIKSLGLLAAVPAIYAYWGARLTRRIGYAPLVLAVGWVIVELALEPLTLRDGLLAASQSDGGLMRLVGTLLGYVFIGFIIAFVNAQILSLVPFVNIQFGLLMPQPVVPLRLCLIGTDRQTISHQCHLYSLTPRAPPLLLHASVSL